MYKLLKGAWVEAAKGVKDKETINYDSFLRLNVRLDLIMDEMEVMQEGAREIDEVISFLDSTARKIYTIICTKRLYLLHYHSLTIYLIKSYIFLL
jgi:hypothetical protein